MPYLKGKSRGTNAWLPTQVEYGIDCSDPDPAKWKPFGREAENFKPKFSKGPPAPPPKPEQ